MKQTQDYINYLNSSSWRHKRSEALKRAGNCCQNCGKSISEVRLDVHHETYKHLGNENLDELKVLCTICHKSADLSRAMRSWAEKVYGEDWFENYDNSEMAEKFYVWLEQKNNEEY